MKPVESLAAKYMYIKKGMHLGDNDPEMMMTSYMYC